MSSVQSWHVRGEVHEGAACESIGARLLQDAEGLRVEGSVVVQPFATGCGCPTGPHYTLVVEPGSSPLRVHACDGPGTDSCEAACQGTFRWDLSGPMKDAGAREIRLVR